MLIRKPVAEVFEAFINPDITTKFWFTKSSGRLEAGKLVQWAWNSYSFALPVSAKAIEPNKRIVIEWPGYKGLRTVEWTFVSLDDGATFVGITESGFRGDSTELVRQVSDSTEGFSLVSVTGAVPSCGFSASPHTSQSITTLPTQAVADDHLLRVTQLQLACRLAQSAWS